MTSKRRFLGRMAVMASGAALVLTILIAASLTIIPALDVGDARRALPSLHTETMSLTCLSPQQAADIISPYIRYHGSTYYIPSTGISAITVRGTLEELAKSRNLIHDFESDPNAACHNPAVVAGMMQDQRRRMQSERNAAPHVAGDKEPTAPKTK